MSRPRNLVVLVLLSLLLCIHPIANQASSQDKHEEFWQLVKTVQDILEGKNDELAITSIAHGARLVCRVRFEDLKSVVAGEIKTCSLADTSYHGVMIQAKSNPSEDMGFLILKTQTSDRVNVRFHTVVFMKDSAGLFKIQHWHTGDCDR